MSFRQRPVFPANPDDGCCSGMNLLEHTTIEMAKAMVGPDHGIIGVEHADRIAECALLLAKRVLFKLESEQR